MTQVPEQPPMTQTERTFAVDSMSRVEGEGRLKVVVRGDEVVRAELSIFASSVWLWAESPTRSSTWWPASAASVRWPTR